MLRKGWRLEKEEGYWTHVETGYQVTNRKAAHGTYIDMDHPYVVCRAKELGTGKTWTTLEKAMEAVEWALHYRKVHGHFSGRWNRL